MAKTKRARKQAVTVPIVNEDSLPQNIHLVGERDVESKKTVYILQSVYKLIHRFAEAKTSVESGGVLVGRTVEQFGKTSIIVNGFVEAKYTEATATTLKFTHETWEYCHKEIAKKFVGQKIIGWIHTHPDFGIFLSEYDEFIQSNFFKDENQVAYVIDPIQNIEGIYVWRDEKITRCGGFFVFDKTGVRITSATEHQEHYELARKPKTGLIAGISISILAIVIFTLVWQISNLHSKFEKLQIKQQTIVDSANQSLDYMQRQIAALQVEINALKPTETPTSQSMEPLDGDETQLKDTGPSSNTSDEPGSSTLSEGDGTDAN